MGLCYLPDIPFRPPFCHEISRESCRTPSKGNGQQYAEAQSNMPAHLKNPLNSGNWNKISNSPFELYSQQDLINNREEIKTWEECFPRCCKMFLDSGNCKTRLENWCPWVSSAAGPGGTCLES